MAQLFWLSLDLRDIILINHLGAQYRSTSTSHNNNAAILVDHNFLVLNIRELHYKTPRETQTVPKQAERIY